MNNFHNLEIFGEQNNRMNIEVRKASKLALDLAIVQFQ